MQQKPHHRQEQVLAEALAALVQLETHPRLQAAMALLGKVALTEQTGRAGQMTGQARLGSPALA